MAEITGYLLLQCDENKSVFSMNNCCCRRKFSYAPKTSDCVRASSTLKSPVLSAEI
ncbi:Uncharacterized protein APZ42_024189 [Daphnia magna]|uniref:Uncharacterized protein n=1 Tax=Daphnia magna TaxID=35525 RepID=A0A164UHZ3_9CRUS|nr:Uncharacterized protein APZ42_024189 [Daphnia magna]